MSDNYDPRNLGDPMLASIGAVVIEGAVLESTARRLIDALGLVHKSGEPYKPEASISVLADALKSAKPEAIRSHDLIDALRAWAAGIVPLMEQRNRVVHSVPFSARVHGSDWVDLKHHPKNGDYYLASVEEHHELALRLMREHGRGIDLWARILES